MSWLFPPLPFPQDFPHLKKTELQYVTMYVTLLMKIFIKDIDSWLFHNRKIKIDKGTITMDTDITTPIFCQRIISNFHENLETDKRYKQISQISLYNEKNETVNVLLKKMKLNTKTIKLIKILGITNYSLQCKDCKVFFATRDMICSDCEDRENSMLYCETHDHFRSFCSNCILDRDSQLKTDNCKICKNYCQSCYKVCVENVLDKTNKDCSNIISNFL